MKTSFKKIKTEKKKKNKNVDKTKELDLELVKIKYANNPNKLQSELKEIIIIHVVNKNLHEIENEILLDFTGEIEMVSTLKVVDQSRQTHIRFRYISDYEAYINAIDEGYDADSFFNGYIYKINTPQFNFVDRSQYGNGCDFKHGIIEYQCNNCFIPTKGYCFVNCINFLTGEDYTQQYLDFIWNEKRRSNYMTMARIQPFFRAKNINLGYYDGTRVFLRSVTERNIALKLHNIHFCLICKSEGVSFNQAIKELKYNFKIVDNYKTERNVNCYFE